MKRILIAGVLGVYSTVTLAVTLVTDSTIKQQKDLTSQFKLRNGIEVHHRSVPGSDIVEVDLIFNSGLKDSPQGKKVIGKWALNVMSMASKAYPKEKMYEIVEKYSFETACSQGIEYTTCGLGTLNDYFEKGLEVFSDFVINPQFAEEDAALVKQQMLAMLREVPTDPGGYSNEIVNKVFYPKNHPYRHDHEDAMKELEKFGVKDLKEYHKGLLNSHNMKLVVVSSLKQSELKKALDNAFGGIGKAHDFVAKVVPPKFDERKSVNFEHREIPTAYIKAKFVLPPVDSSESEGLRLMISILDEMLGEEVRTKRSLSYSVYAYLIQYSMGLGVVGASTSKPKETLEAIEKVIADLKARTLSAEELEEHKRGFATKYFFTLETHRSLVSAISRSVQYFGTSHQLYEMPKNLDSVDSKMIKRLANKYLKDFRLGIVFDEKKFKMEWAKKFVSNLKRQ